MEYQKEKDEFGKILEFRIANVVKPKKNKKLPKKSKLNQTRSDIFGNIYFNFNDKVKLKFSAEREWLGCPEEFPIETKTVENNFDHKKGSELSKKQKTICYENFKEEIEIFWVSNRKKIKIKTDKIFKHLIIHVPEHARYFCVEPVSHPTDGFNLAYKKIENINYNILMPNQKIKGSIKIEIDNF